MNVEIFTAIEHMGDCVEMERGPAVASASLASFGLKLIQLAESPAVAGVVFPRRIAVRRSEILPAGHHAISLSMAYAHRVLGR